MSVFFRDRDLDFIIRVLLHVGERTGERRHRRRAMMYQNFQRREPSPLKLKFRRDLRIDNLSDEVAAEIILQFT